MIESLIKAGAFDSTGANRAQLTEALDRALESGLRASRDRAMGQHGLFGLSAADHKTEHPLAKLQDWTMEQKLAGEREVLGIYVSGHPLDRFKDKVSDLATHFTDKLGRPRKKYSRSALRYSHQHCPQDKPRRKVLGRSEAG